LEAACFPALPGEEWTIFFPGCRPFISRLTPTPRKSRDHSPAPSQAGFPAFFSADCLFFHLIFFPRCFFAFRAILYSLWRQLPGGIRFSWDHSLDALFGVSAPLGRRPAIGRTRPVSQPPRSSGLPSCQPCNALACGLPNSGYRVVSFFMQPPALVRPPGKLPSKTFIQWSLRATEMFFSSTAPFFSFFRDALFSFF